MAGAAQDAKQVPVVPASVRMAILRRSGPVIRGAQIGINHLVF
jgi:hypothetical protein